MPVQGTPVFNALALAEVTINFTGGGVNMKAKAAFVNSTTGHTHGWTTGDNPVWSKETIEVMMSLRERMEQDLAKLHLSDANIMTSNATTARDTRPSGGLLQHLVGKEPPQV